MGAKRKTVTMSSTDEVKKVKPKAGAEEVAAEMPAMTTAAPTEEAEKPKKEKKLRQRSKKYAAVRAQIDKTKKYDPFAAVELIKKLSYTSFEGTVTAHVVVKEVGMSVSVTLPHSTGQSVRVVIADENVLKDIEAGKLDFDILLAEPKYMPKLAKFAPVLGPKGLMPNPKNGTLTPNPAVQKKKLEAGAMTIKTEKKAPLLHVRLGKTSMETKKLVENLEALVKAINLRLDRVALAATMSPGVKVDVEKML